MVVVDDQALSALALALLRTGAPPISSERARAVAVAVAVEVREASVAPDCALTRPKRSHGNATHRNCLRGSWRNNPQQEASCLAMTQSRDETWPVGVGGQL